MLNVRKFEFINNKNVYSVVECPPETSPKSIPEGDGRFIRTWIGTSGAYAVKMLQESTSKFVRTLCEPRGFYKIKNGEHL